VPAEQGRTHLQQLLSKLVHDELRIAAQLLETDPVHGAGQQAKEKQVPVDDGLNPRPLDLQPAGRTMCGYAPRRK
jgi:hypothetical protein